VDIHGALSDDLAGLTDDALDVPGDDLQAMLEVLFGDLTAAVPSFIGLRMTVHADDTAVTLNAVEPQLAPTTRSTLLLPLHRITGAQPVATVLLYAAEPGGFTELAVLTRRVFDLDGEVVLDGHVPAVDDPPALPGIGDTNDATLINRAIGVLIDQGYPPEQTHAELAHRAAQHHTSVSTAASALLS
jgi:hypothetical protein